MFLQRKHCHQCQKVTDHHNGACSVCVESLLAESKAKRRRLLTNRLIKNDVVDPEQLVAIIFEITEVLERKMDEPNRLY